MVNLLRAILFAIIFYTGSLFYVLAGFIAAAIGDGTMRRHAIRWALFHRWCTRLLLGIKSRVEGTIPSGPVLFVSKHQSMYETIELLCILDQPVVVMKQELTDVPLWGWVAQAYGVIPVNRVGSGAALRQLMRAAKVAKDSGRPVLIFPEGTRVPIGEQPELKPGFAGLYRQLNLLTVPIALDSGRLSPRHSFIKKPGIITFRFGEPIAPGLPREEIEALAHHAINALDREAKR